MDSFYPELEHALHAALDKLEKNTILWDRKGRRAEQRREMIKGLNSSQ